MLLIQVVEILWTKATRGAPRAHERVVLPRAFAVAPVSTSTPACLIQRYQMAEWKDFAPQLYAQDEWDTLPGSVDALQVIALGGSRYSLGLYGTPHDGQPHRYPRLRAITLNNGETARLIINARHTSYSGQHYSETIYNLASTEQLCAHLFLQPPTHLLDLKAHLF